MNSSSPHTGSYSVPGVLACLCGIHEAILEAEGGGGGQCDQIIAF